MTNYPTNVSNSQWQVISKQLDVQRSRKYDLREVVNAILYLVKTSVAMVHLSAIRIVLC